ncbi:MAG: hypothetical protein EP330_28015 [Deltaproteobacteria bacterium]|nr:MAG: hypothetical protein EP330_28015 [Deltaproteobacteria bacterium]
MSNRDTMLAVVVAGLLAAVLWLLVRTEQLAAEVAALRADRVVAPVAAAPVVRAAGGDAGPAGARVEAEASAEGVAELDARDLEALVHRTVAQQTQEREAEQAAKWVEAGTRWTETFVGDLVEEGLVAAEQEEAVITVLVNEMHDGMAMKSRFESEPAEAWAEWQELVAANDARLTELIGEEATQSLRERTGRK